MFFTLKKVISLFLMPMSIGFILFIIGLFFLLNKSYSKAKAFLVISFLWLFLISYSPFSNYLMKPIEQQYSSYIKIDKSIKYVLVLGNGHVTNKNVSAVSQLSNTALMRLIEGIRIYKELDAAKLIVSGYAGADIMTPHAFVLRDVALSLGVPLIDIITQEKAKDTKEEAIYAKDTIKDDILILVTSASHMPRAMKIFKSLSLNVIAAPTDYLSKEDGDYLEIPRGKELRKTEVAIHEYIGILWHDIIEKIRFFIN